MENKIFDPDICAKSDFKKILCITPVINTELHCATKTDEKNLLLQQPKKKKATSLCPWNLTFFVCFKCAVGHLCLQGLGAVVYITNWTST